MAKPTVLTSEALLPSTGTMPSAATPPRVPKARPSPAAKPLPLQIRLPREEVKAIKVAAAESEQTISEFMLTCFHAYMKACKQT